MRATQEEYQEFVTAFQEDDQVFSTLGKLISHLGGGQEDLDRLNARSRANFDSEEENLLFFADVLATTAQYVQKKEGKHLPPFGISRLFVGDEGDFSKVIYNPEVGSDLFLSMLTMPRAGGGTMAISPNAKHDESVALILGALQDILGREKGDMGMAVFMQSSPEEDLDVPEGVILLDIAVYEDEYTKPREKDVLVGRSVDHQDGAISSFWEEEE